MVGTKYDGSWNNDYSYIGVPGSTLSPARNGTVLVFTYYIKFQDPTTNIQYGAYVDASNGQVRLVRNLSTGAATVPL